MATAEATDDVAGLAAELVRLPTENPPGDERACAEFVVEWFETHGIESALVETPGYDRPNAVGVVGDPDDDGPTLVLNGHTDVVPAGDPGRWRHDPFGGAIEDGRLYGRGAADMKTGLAVAMLTARDLAEEIAGGGLPGSIVVHAAMGEETGEPGTRALLDAGYGGDCAIVLEPTDFRVGTSGKGVATFRIGVGGEACHASRPDQGGNAVDRARPVLDAIDALDERVRERVDPLVGRAYATVTEFEAGTDSNFAVVPERAELLLDRRVLPGETYDAVEAEIRAALASVEDDSAVDASSTEDDSAADAASVETDLELVKYYAPSEIPVDGPLAATVRRHSADLADAPTEPWGLAAATDAREFVADGVPAIIWGPGSLAQAHTVDEHVAVADAELGLAILERAARELLSG